jgi:hypothetical protein
MMVCHGAEDMYQVYILSQFLDALHRLISCALCQDTYIWFLMCFFFCHTLVLFLGHLSHFIDIFVFCCITRVNFTGLHE